MMTQQERIMRHIEERYGSEPEHLWAQYPDYVVYRHSASRKWYAVFLTVPKDKLGFEGTDPVCVLDIKCSPLMIGSLLSEKGFLPAYHMNKNHWISVLMDGQVADDQIFSLLEFSYDSAAPKRKVKR